MEAVLSAFPRDHQSTLAPNKQNKIRTPNRRNVRSNKFIPNNNNPSAGLLNHPPPPSSLDPHAHAFYLYSSSSSSSSKSYQQQNHHQPPLLPLPTTISKTHHPLQSSRNTTRSMSFTPKKSSSKPTMRDNNNIEVKKRSPATQSMSDFLIPIVFTSSSTTMTSDENYIGMLSGPASFNVVSPPPSSLPMPRFCDRSKLSCNARTSEAEATHNLHRVLHLRE